MSRIVIIDNARNDAEVARIADRIRAAAQDPDASWWSSSRDAVLDRAIESTRRAMDAFQAEANPNVGVFRALIASAQGWAPMPITGPLGRTCPKCGAQPGEGCSRTFAHRFHRARLG